ncbi:stage II sporulation protein R [Anaerocolumna sp.]|uniref:stage II sporulation protein R n=1 Tax=Anaerocolumna sp. TaxID=2041569 RepID=UPI0028A675FD|nr:stage II sporulation protein R [Anaerocolumna sp.]
MKSKYYSPTTDRIFQRIVPCCLILIITIFYIIYHLQNEGMIWTEHTSFNRETISTGIHNDVRQSTEAERELRIQQGIAKEILRFHVIANSDSEEDQVLKLKVKDAVTKALQPKLNKANDVNEARNILDGELNNLVELSDKIIQENGFTYTASASIEKGYFPLKVYGDLTLPPGEYEAVRIELGSASGRNWWCIMFPPLCFVDATYNVIPEDSKEELKYVLTEEEYDSIFSKKNDKEKVKVKVSFKLLSWLDKWMDNK